MATLERIYTIPLADAYEAVRNKRGKRAITIIRAFALRHMKASGVKISEGVNSAILRDGIQKPPRRIKVRIHKAEDSSAKVWLIGEEEKLKEEADRKKKDEEARKKKADEAKKKAEPKPDAQKPSEKKPEAQKKPEAPKAAPAKP